MNSMTTPSGYWGRYFLKELTMDPLGMEWANCFRTHNELTMGPLSILVFAPSVSGPTLKNWLQRTQEGEENRVYWAVCEGGM